MTGHSRSVIVAKVVWEVIYNTSHTDIVLAKPVDINGSLPTNFVSSDSGQAHLIVPKVWTHSFESARLVRRWTALNNLLETHRIAQVSHLDSPWSTRGSVLVEKKRNVIALYVFSVEGRGMGVCWSYSWASKVEKYRAVTAGSMQSFAQHADTHSSTLVREYWSDLTAQVFVGPLEKHAQIITPPVPLQIHVTPSHQPNWNGHKRTVWLTIKYFTRWSCTDTSQNSRIAAMDMSLRAWRTWSEESWCVFKFLRDFDEKLLTTHSGEHLGVEYPAICNARQRRDRGIVSKGQKRKRWWDSNSEVETCEPEDPGQQMLKFQISNSRVASTKFAIAGNLRRNQIRLSAYVI